MCALHFVPTFLSRRERPQGRDRKAEAQDGLATCPRTRSREAAELGLHFRVANSTISSTVYFRNTKISSTKVFFSQARTVPFIRRRESESGSERERGRERKREREGERKERKRKKEREGGETERGREKKEIPPAPRLWELPAHWAVGAWPSGNIMFIRATPTSTFTCWGARGSPKDSYNKAVSSQVNEKKKTPNLL